METIKITIEGMGAKHEFDYPADVAAAFMDKTGIRHDGTVEGIKAAFAETAEFMLRPVTETGTAALAEARRNLVAQGIKGE